MAAGVWAAEHNKAQAKRFRHPQRGTCCSDCARDSMPVELSLLEVPLVSDYSSSSRPATGALPPEPASQHCEPIERHRQQSAAVSCVKSTLGNGAYTGNLPRLAAGSCKPAAAIPIVNISPTSGRLACRRA